MKNRTLEDLINEYIKQVQQATELLEHSFGTKDILELWWTNKIPRCGVLTDGVEYELHGVGCSVYLTDRCIDFDYGPGGRVDGFDPWRLYMYACETPQQHKKYTDMKLLEHEFNEYLEKGKVRKIEGSMSNLYFIQP
ncbi:DUF6896 domain-containing protein [Pseudomonas sp. BIGb0164]|uniref:DUF6896 domain-containing protein n=1 Tax=Pseudomonas sp. BIGb0164 TaxID=2940605 RepID=UPI00216981C4|nr:hypothetical protein [Pseudomonas sp. BIGb0164]MCS4249896.1 hypothetical protein [Pseudomonas sp. BIGb0164]